jgi:tetratricopeptide (TPR) repeat protein
MQKPTEAVASFTEALRLRPSSANALAYRGMGYAQSGKYDLALADSNQSLLLDPENANGYACRGSVSLQLRRYEQAVADLSASLEREPDPNAYRWEIRATAYLNLRRWADAEKDLEAALQRDPFRAALYNLRSILRAAQGKWDEAVSDFAHTSPADDQALFAQAAAALLRGDLEGYRKTCDGLLNLAGALGGTKAEMGRPFSPARMAARAVALAEKPSLSPEQLCKLAEAGPRVPGRPDNVFLQRIKALVWVRTGRAKEAIGLLEAGLKAAPDYSPGINNLLLCLAHKELGHPEESDRAYQRALDAGITVIHVHDTLEYQVLLREARKGRGQP